MGILCRQTTERSDVARWQPVPGCAVWRAGARAAARICRGGDAHHGARDWRDGHAVQRLRRCAAAAAAVGTRRPSRPFHRDARRRHPPVAAVDHRRRLARDGSADDGGRPERLSRSTVTLAVGDVVERGSAVSVTPGTFAMLRASPLVGRVFTTDDAPEVVLSYGFWMARFAGAADAIGRPSALNGQTVTIVGVMPPDFEFPDPGTRVWRPLRVPPPPAVTILSSMARLHDRTTPAQAAEEATASVRSAKYSTNALLAVFGGDGPARIVADPALDALTRDVRPGLVALFAAGLLLLLMAVANLASLELARATTRYREIAIRSALGAGPRRVVQQLVLEQLLLAAAGGGARLVLAVVLHRALPAMLPADFPRIHEIAFGMPVVLVAFAIAASTGVVMGVLPAWHLRRLRLTQALGEGAAGAVGGTRTRARAWIMTGQIAIASTLLVIALLLGRSFVAMLQQDRGFDPAHLITARLSLPHFAFTPAARIDAVEQFVLRARELPGAPVVAVTTGLPLSGSENITGFDMPSVRPPVGAPVHLHAVRSVVTADYIRALGLRLLCGPPLRPPHG